MQRISLEVSKLAKNASILIVDDSKVSLEMYRLMLGEMFKYTYTAINGKEAYDFWLSKDKNIDIILTDMIMPVMDGNELIAKIRAESNSQKIMVLSGLSNLNEMREIINHGVDGIMLKPFKEETVFPILLRVLSMVKAKKIMKQQYLQLQFLSQENIDLKSCALEHQPHELVHDSDNQPSIKYKIRESFAKGTDKDAIEFYESLDYENIDDADKLQHELEEIEVRLFALSSSDSIDTIQEILLASLATLSSVSALMESLGGFDVASESALHIVEYIKNLDFTHFEDSEKRDLFIHIYISMFEDTQKWIETVFIDNDRENINYFDASLANTCLELETVFSEGIHEDDDSELEFF